MSPKWTTPEQEELLEKWYGRYVQMSHSKKRSLYKDFWESLKGAWVQEFGWKAEDDSNASRAPSLNKVRVGITSKCVHTTEKENIQRIHQWFNNRGKQKSKSYSVSPAKIRNHRKILAKRQRLQLWQAFGVMNADAVKVRVDERYQIHLQEAGRENKKAMSRLRMMQINCLEMLEEGGEELKETVRKRMADDIVDIPDYLVEAQDMLREEEVKRYAENYHRQQ